MFFKLKTSYTIFYFRLAFMFKHISLQEEVVVNTNESDTESEEENELIIQKYCSSLENNSLPSDNSGVCNALNMNVHDLLITKKYCRKIGLN